MPQPIKNLHPLFNRLFAVNLIRACALCVMLCGAVFVLFALVACGADSNIPKHPVPSNEAVLREHSDTPFNNEDSGQRRREETGSVFDVFSIGKTGDSVNVNRYLWAASLDVLDFMPLDSADPFTGLISTDWGTPPGGRDRYRATIHIRGPQLDATNLKVTLYNAAGVVDGETLRVIEDAILTRARQMRVEVAGR